MTFDHYNFQYYILRFVDAIDVVIVVVVVVVVAAAAAAAAAGELCVYLYIRINTHANNNGNSFNKFDMIFNYMMSLVLTELLSIKCFSLYYTNVL